MHLQLLMIGKFKNRDLAALVEEYAERIRRFYPCRVVHLKESRCADEVRAAERIRADEADRFLAQIPPGSLCVVLDRGGRRLDSVAFSRWLEGAAGPANRPVIVVIGGFLGVDPRVLERADLVLSLSDMTLPHELAVLVLAEQLFRACTIMHRVPYHK
jgi:23S rRNA (pseudouridine1915-N3)-methyltransferase